MKDGLVSDLLNWPYSNYLEWIGERDGILVDRSFVLAQFPDPGGYREFVADYLQTRLMPETVVNYIDSLEA